MKTCTKCGTARALDEFTRDRNRPDGRFPWCKPCKRAGDGTSYRRSHESRKATMRQYYRDNAERIKAERRAYYQQNPDVIAARVLRWQAANPERVRAIKRASQARRWAADPERHREVWRRRKAALKRGVAVYDFSPALIEAKILYWGGRCWMCGGPADCLDHVKPLAAGGPHMLANLRPACTPCNSRKRHAWPYTPQRPPP